jgi:hypothetical protein
MNPLIRWIKRLEARFLPPVLALAGGGEITLTTKQLRDKAIVVASGTGASDVVLPDDILVGSGLTVVNTSDAAVTVGETDVEADGTAIWTFNASGAVLIYNGPTTVVIPE